jgi:hypothetical protein
MLKKRWFISGRLREVGYHGGGRCNPVTTFLQIRRLEWEASSMGI